MRGEQGRQKGRGCLKERGGNFKIGDMTTLQTMFSTCQTYLKISLS